MSNIDIEYKLVRDVTSEVEVRAREAGGVIEYLNRHGWIRTPEEAEAAAGGETPGRTITESRRRELDLQWRTDLNYSFDDLITDLGLTVTPDHEPTNAEKLNVLCSDWTFGRNCLDGENLSDYLDRHGVAAPEADDEQ